MDQQPPQSQPRRKASLIWRLTRPMAPLFRVFTLRRRWTEPLDRLLGSLQQIRQGEATIDQLPCEEGPLASLAREIQGLLRDLRVSRAQLAQAELEMRQRVAQRTDALERLISSLRMQANRDSLTALFNRRMFDQHIPALAQQLREDGKNLCVVLMDLDYFKLLNDTLGHQAGDEFLRNVGQIIRSSIRGQDLAFRMGGDEFLVVMPDAGLDAGTALARRVKSLVDSLGRSLKLPQNPGISTGAASLSELIGGDLARLLETADRRLYDDKAARHRKAA